MGDKYKFMPSKEYLLDCYFVQSMTFSDIAKENKVTSSTVNYWFKKYKISARPKSVKIHQYHMTDKGRENIVMTHKGKKLSPENIRKISEANRLKTETGHKKVRDDGYISIYAPNYHSANADGYVMEHRYIMEKHLGRLLSKNEVVHHINHIRCDNRIENLQLMTVAEHARLHSKERWNRS